MLRKTIFWTHLVCGVAAGLVILLMSFTGVLLTYERQILAWAEQADYLQAPQRQGERLPLERLQEIARENHDFSPSSIVVQPDPGAPVVFRGGRRGPSLSLNPYSGEPMETGSPGLESLFSTLTGLHRWFNLEGEARATARAITGASNLVFLFLILSGLYLWLPRLWKWSLFRARLFLHKAPDARTRDFNWHHVFGLWSALPLIVVVATASVFYYDWANTLVYRAFGEEPPQRGGGPGAGAGGGQGQAVGVLATSTPAPVNPRYSLDELVQQAGDYLPGWRQISLTPPGTEERELRMSLDLGNGGQPHLRHNLRLDRLSGEVVAHEPFSSQSPGQQARSIVRFLHTGEVLGIAGQTIAGLVSLTSLLMVWTGLALAWRRLISPLLRKRA